MPAPDLFDAKVGATAWRSKPSWYIIAKNDRTVRPDCERFLAKRMGATTTEAASSHVVMLSQPQVAIDVIRKAVKAAQAVTAPTRVWSFPSQDAKSRAAGLGCSPAGSAVTPP